MLNQLPAAVGGLLGFIVVLFLGSRVAPGHRAQGGATGTGERLTYVLNGLVLFLLVLALVLVTEISGLHPLAWIHNHFWQLFASANIFASVAAVLLYIRGSRRDAPTSGRWQTLRGIFCGVEMNPRLWQVDLKLFSYRPSLIGLALLNLSCAAAQFHTFGRLSDGMLLYQLFTLVYVFNYFQFEYGMLHTWDIVAERFGWMLVWGDYVLVPFFYSLPGWYLLHQTKPLPAWAITGLLALYGVGFWLFRGANAQKHRFKRDPSVTIWGRPAETIEGRLLVSGFWGIGRHLNYSGEICLYFAFALTTGFDSFVPYLLPLWLTGLLVHRARRDEARCRAKYGEAWERYSARVRFRLIPFVY